MIELPKKKKRKKGSVLMEVRQLGFMILSFDVLIPRYYRTIGCQLFFIFLPFGTSITFDSDILAF